MFQWLHQICTKFLEGNHSVDKNKNKGHPKPETFKVDDFIITRQIQELNYKIWEINDQLSLLGPLMFQWLHQICTKFLEGNHSVDKRFEEYILCYLTLGFET
jgi:hypothetical protein